MILAFGAIVFYGGVYGKYMYCKKAPVQTYRERIAVFSS
jgi:hypothetical protein